MKSTYFALLVAPLLSMASYAGNEGPTPGTPPPQPVPSPTQVPLVKCVPQNKTAFAFQLNSNSGCTLTPGGYQCGDRISMALFGVDPTNGKWKFAGGADGLTNSASIGENTFSYHYRSSDGVHHIDVEVKNGQSMVDISLGVGFDLVPEVNTHGPQSTYHCRLLK